MPAPADPLTWRTLSFFFYRVMRLLRQMQARPAFLGFYLLSILLPEKSLGAGGSTPSFTQSPPATIDWPSDGDYQNFTCGGQTVYDGIGDTNGASNDRDIVGFTSDPNAFYPAAKFKTTTLFLFIRLRLDSDPTQTTGQSTGLSAFGWGIAFDTNNNRNNYEYAAIANGVADKLQIYSYSGDGVSPSATPLREAAFGMLTSNAWVRVSNADSNYSSDPDYFLDIAIPLNDFENATSGDTHPFLPGQIKLWIATSSNGTTMSADFMCWGGPVGDADLANIPLTTAGIGAFVAISLPADNSSLTSITPSIVGTATPGETITLALQSSGHSATVTSDSSGNWSYSVPSSWGLLYGNSNKTISASLNGGSPTSSVTLNFNCPSGFELPSGQSTSATCLDIDECALGTHSCGILACANTSGAYVCGCPSGQTFNGTACIPGSVIFTTPSAWDATFTTKNPVLSGKFNVIDAGVDPISMGTKSDGDPIVVGGQTIPLNINTIQSVNSPSWSLVGATDNASIQSDDWSFTVPDSWGLLYGASYLVGVGIGTNQTSQALKINIACASGYEPANAPAASSSCIDIDECARNTDNCDPNHGVCTNLVGSFSCTCAANYTGNGVTCTANPTYALSLSTPGGSSSDLVTPILTGMITRSDGSTTSPLSGIVITISDGTNSSTITTTAGGAWTYTVPTSWGWRLGENKVVTLTLWNDTLIKNLSLACINGYQPSQDLLSCEIIPPSPSPSTSPSPSPNPSPSPSPTTTSIEKASTETKIELTIEMPQPGEVLKTSTPTFQGTAEPGSVLTITVGGQSGTAKSNEDGIWTFTVPSAWDLRKGPQILVVTHHSGESITVEWERACADGQVYNVAGQCFKDEYILQGSGSQTLRVCGVIGPIKPEQTPATHWPMMIFIIIIPALLAPRLLYKIIFILICVIFGTSPASALNVQIFKPILDTNGLIGVVGSKPTNSGECWLGAYGNKDVRPIELATPLGVRISDVISELYSVDLAPTCGINANTTISAHIPFHWVKQGSQVSNSQTTSFQGYGDTDLMLRWNLRSGEDESRVGITVAPYITVPSKKKMDVLGTQMTLLGESHYSGGLKVIADKTFYSRHYLASNLGYHYRPREDFLNIRLEPEWRLAAGYAYLMHAPTSTQLALEWHRREPSGRFRKDRFTAPTEIYTGVSSLVFSKNSRLFAGASAGLSTGYGAPAYRFYTGLEVNLQPTHPKIINSGPYPRLPAIDTHIKDDAGSPLVADRVIVRNINQPGRFTAEQGTSGATLGPLTLGLHRLTVEKSGYLTENLGVSIHSLHDHPKVTVTLRPLGGQLVTKLHVSGNLDPTKIGFHLSGGMQEIAGTFESESKQFSHVPIGVHTFTIKGPQLAPVSQRFIVTDASATTLNIVIEDGKTIIIRNTLDFGEIFFDTDQAVIKQESIPTLNKVVTALKEHKKVRRVAIEGYTDNIGPRLHNLALSHARAEAVRSYLVDHGVEPHRLSTTGFGADTPLNSNETASGRRANRRVEFVVADIVD